MRWTYLRLRLKDYDALVGLTFGTSDLQCAIEYERSTKSAARYVDIRRQLAQETMVHAVIHIVKGVERILSIVERLSSPTSRVLFVTSSAFLRFGPNAYRLAWYTLGDREHSNRKG